jgi:hypothetical protein
MRHRIFTLLLAVVALVPVHRAADQASNGPISIVLTYKARPETRAAFREWVETKGAARFATWKKDGVVADAQLLFSTFASAANPDLVVVLDFARLTDSARWREIERRSPGGLTPEALALAHVESANYGEPLARGAASRRDPARAAYLVVTYATHVSAAEYAKYVAGYTVPQMKEWMAAGPLTAYAMFYNTTSFNTPWDSMLILEYADLAAFARRDEIKWAARAKLNASDPVFKAYTDSKARIRDDRAMFHADAIPLPER